MVPGQIGLCHDSEPDLRFLPGGLYSPVAGTIPFAAQKTAIDEFPPQEEVIPKGMPPVADVIDFPF